MRQRKDPAAGLARDERRHHGTAPSRAEAQPVGRQEAANVRVVVTSTPDLKKSVHHVANVPNHAHREIPPAPSSSQSANYCAPRSTSRANAPWLTPTSGRRSCAKSRVEGLWAAQEAARGEIRPCRRRCARPEASGWRASRATSLRCAVRGRRSKEGAGGRVIAARDGADDGVGRVAVEARGECRSPRPFARARSARPALVGGSSASARRTTKTHRLLEHRLALLGEQAHEISSDRGEGGGASRTWPPGARRGGASASPPPPSGASGEVLIRKTSSRERARPTARRRLARLAEQTKHLGDDLTTRADAFIAQIRPRAPT